MFVLALASLVFGYAVLYYAIDAMSHYDSGAKTTKGIPLSVALGIPGGDASTTAMVFAKWGQAAPSPSTTGAASTSPGDSTGPTVVV